MFCLPTETTDRIDQAIAGRVCTAGDGSYITRSFGRRRPDRATRYVVHVVNGKSFTLSAYTDDAAVVAANKRVETNSPARLRQKDDEDGRNKTAGI